MGTEWQFLTLNEANVVLIDCDHRTPSASAGGYPYIAIPQIKQGRIELSEVRRISTRDYIDWTRKAKPQADDVVLSRRCNPGETAVVPLGLECALGQNLVLLRADGTKVFPPFLRWLVRGPDWWEQVGKYINVGAVFDSLKCADIPKFRLPIPPLQEQRAIASALGSLDNKIDLNRRMNETLEAMARGIFRDWFVDFGPTYAKIEHRRPYLAPDIWVLFPDELDDRSNPIGWYEERLLDHARLISGGTPKTEVAEYWGGSIAWASAKDVSQCSDPFLIGTERLITERGLEESSTRMIPKLATVVVARGATTGRFCMFGEEMAMNQTCYALDSTRQRPFWLNCAFSNVVNVLVHAGHGSVFNTITTTTVESARVILAPTPLMTRFEETVSPLFNRMLLNIKESHTLGSLRDRLLPKLMSGEVRVKDAETILAEVA